MRVSRLLIYFSSMNSIHHCTMMRNSMKKNASQIAIEKHLVHLVLRLTGMLRSWMNACVRAACQVEVQREICSNLYSSFLLRTSDHLTLVYLQDDQFDK